MYEDRGLLTWRNSGYKKRDSTSNQLIHLVNRIYRGLDSRQESALVFLDQSRAFDRIYHAGLKKKMKVFGIDGPLYDLLSNYLEDRKIRVVLDGSKSKWRKTTAGVPQGSILGPLMFLIYVNDIVEELESEIYLYADDTALIINFKKEDTIRSFDQLNRDLGRLARWARDWYMLFNPTKTKYMIISNRHQDMYPSLKLNDEELERVPTYPQLGLHINENMNWKNT